MILDDLVGRTRGFCQQRNSSNNEKRQRGQVLGLNRVGFLFLWRTQIVGGDEVSFRVSVRSW